MEGMGLPNLDEYFSRFDQGHPRSLYVRDRSLRLLGEQMRLAREAMGMSLREASRVSGLTRIQLRRIEACGEARLSWLLRLSEIYGCRLDVAASFPEMSPLWRKNNLRRREERETMRLRQFWRRRGYADVPGRSGPSLPAA